MHILFIYIFWYLPHLCEKLIFVISGRICVLERIWLSLFGAELYYSLTVHLTIHDLIFSSIFYLFLLLIIDHESKHSLSTHRYYFFEVRVDTYWVYGVGFTRTILLHHVWRLRHRYQWGPGVCPVALSTDSR